ncbi:hypothetical protein BDA99DRAFT_534734 [Phascolomyces articulosus]|uniref:Uncharacterized protein n=1 Tax=Phascolomyces articulosus TaxID=60185 RepID=A0AAD5K5Q9_9FUNG|nr:hypothetical protein BDA99DRAFT_534734 [Phascolomyces articulosus]
MRQIPMDSVSNFVSRIFVRRSTKKHRSAPAKPNNNATIGAPTSEENSDPISSEQQPLSPPNNNTAATTTIATTATTTTTPDSFETDDLPPASPITEKSVNVDTLEFAASRDLAYFLDSGWSSSVKKRNEETQQKLSFPAFEYLLHEPAKDYLEEQRPATSSGTRQRSSGRQFFSGTLPRKPKNLSLNRPKSAVSLIKRVRSTPNFKDQQQQQQQAV